MCKLVYGNANTYIGLHSSNVENVRERYRYVLHQSIDNRCNLYFINTTDGRPIVSMIGILFSLTQANIFEYLNCMKVHVSKCNLREFSRWNVFIIECVTPNMQAYVKFHMFNG